MFWRKKNKDNAAEKASHQEDQSTVKVIVRTDIGNVRSNNEDAGSFFKINDAKIGVEKGCLLIVADGMGGHNAGEVASRMAVDIISEEYYKRNSDRSAERSLLKAFEFANKKIFDKASGNSSCKGMGTTCTAVAVSGSDIYFAHAGDSRAYLFKNGAISRITEDHTYVQELVKKGDITLREAETHPQRNILTNAMGTKPRLKVDTGKHPDRFDRNDRILLCSDGLYDYLTDEELAEAMQMSSLQALADHLIAEAKRRGGKDNITLVLAEKTDSLPEEGFKQTRDVDLPKMTRDAELPPEI